MNRFVNKELRNTDKCFCPHEGIFWIINNNLIAITNPINESENEYYNIEHKNVWENIKERYKVKQETVSFDYFPRGRVAVNKRFIDGDFDHFDVFIYIDICINTEFILNEIKYEFCLTGGNCIIRYIGSTGGITENHYQCHNCRQEDN